jgi:hypothetical protein
MPKSDQFQTVDLFEQKNPNQVVDTLFALSRHATKHGFAGPSLGPKLAKKNERNFSQDQIDKGKNTSTLMSLGSSQGANQSGMSYGARREIGGSEKDLAK